VESDVLQGLINAANFLFDPEKLLINNIYLKGAVFFGI